MFGTFEFVPNFTTESEEEQQAILSKLDYIYSAHLQFCATVDLKLDEWILNFVENFAVINPATSLSTYHLPQRAKPKALIVGNGPSADKLKIMDLSEYEIYSCWHAGYKVPGGPDYVMHSSTLVPIDIVPKPFPSKTRFVGECTTAPLFYKLAKANHNQIYVHYNRENRFDYALVEQFKIPPAPINQSTVSVTAINAAIQCGHDDITLIGVDLSGPGHIDGMRTALELIPRIYADIKFHNLSTSDIKGFTT